MNQQTSKNISKLRWVTEGCRDRKHTALWLGSLVLLLALPSGCKDTAAGQNSAIVQRVKAGGAGDVEVASVEDMTRWFGDHKTTVNAVYPMCKKIEPNEPASWRSSTEGRICTAADPFEPMPIPVGDGRYFK